MDFLNSLDQEFLTKNPDFARIFYSEENQFASILRAERIKHSLSLDSISEHLHINVQDIINIENGNFQNNSAFSKIIEMYGLHYEDNSFKKNRIAVKA